MAETLRYLTGSALADIERRQRRERGEATPEDTAHDIAVESARDVLRAETVGTIDAKLAAAISQAIHDEREACANLIDATARRGWGQDAQAGFTVAILQALAHEIRARPGGK